MRIFEGRIQQLSIEVVPAEVREQDEHQIVLSNENPRSKLRGIGYTDAIRLTSFRRKGERPKGRGIYPT